MGVSYTRASFWVPEHGVFGCWDLNSVVLWFVFICILAHAFLMTLFLLTDTFSSEPCFSLLGETSTHFSQVITMYRKVRETWKMIVKKYIWPKSVTKQYHSLSHWHHSISVLIIVSNKETWSWLKSAWFLGSSLETSENQVCHWYLFSVFLLPCSTPLPFSPQKSEMKKIILWSILPLSLHIQS